MNYYLIIIRDDPNIKNSDKISYFHILFEYSENKFKGKDNKNRVTISMGGKLKVVWINYNSKFI